MRSLAALAAAILALLALPAAAGAASDLVHPPSLDTPPAGYRLTGNQVEAVAGRVPKIVRAVKAHPGSYPSVWTKGPGRWQVSWFTRGKHYKEIAQVSVDDASGRVLEAWTGFQVPWTMARGYPGAFGRKADSLWIWLPLTILFVAPFVDWRRPRRMLHLDLAVLAAFGISLAFFNHANISASVPVVYPLLAYLLVRMLWIGLRPPGRARSAEPLRLLVPASWLAIATIFLLGFRVGLNVTNSNVIDVGYAGIIGAHKLSHGQPVWGHFPADNPSGDTYGPVAYAAYVPFERIWPWAGRWNGLPGAHAAAIAFDLLCVALLFLIGRRVRGPTLGIALAYAWTAFPFTLFALATNSNDALVSVLVLAALYAALHPARRGVLVGLAGLAKFAPLALAPLFAMHAWPPGRGARTFARFAAGFAVAVGASLALVLWHSSLHTFYDRTLGFQATRGAPFSVWGLYGGGWSIGQHVVQAGAVALAIAVAFLPRRRDAIGLAALSAAVLVALELGATYWFYLYLVWFAPLVLVASLGEPGAAVTVAAAPSTARAPARSHRPAAVVSSG
ncbi:MAG TPA: glycosyltransferase 87 family protein [Solirubrobacteraceae bacterium]|nr:glycosyltransferase 87 family protein [Solirubrobacteraceae bacterium]